MHNEPPPVDMDEEDKEYDNDQTEEMPENEDELWSKDLNQQEISVVRPSYNFDSFSSTLFDKNRIEILKEKLKKRTFKFEFRKEFFLEKVDGQNIIKYIMNVGEILIIVPIDKDHDIFIVAHNNYIHKIHVYYFTFTNIVIHTYTNSIDLKDEYEYIEQKFKDILRPRIERAHLDWGCMVNNRAQFFSMEEDLDDIFYHESYPYIDIKSLCKEFLNSLSPILILLGPPGTGKTRLIRYILRYIASLKENIVRCIFSSDQQIIEDGYIFTRFLTGQYDTLILEDIDFHLTPRTDGNTAMYHLLNISNGVASNYMKYKKIILTTNLPNVNNIDDALLRPGRCFDIIKMRSLDKDESSILLKLLGKEAKLENKSYPISEIYNIDHSAIGISKRAGF
jgi:hypothetical protein